MRETGPPNSGMFNSVRRIPRYSSFPRGTGRPRDRLCAGRLRNRLQAVAHVAKGGFDVRKQSDDPARIVIPRNAATIEDSDLIGRDLSSPRASIKGDKPCLLIR